MDKIKTELFTVAGLAVTIIHLLILIGFASAWIFVRVQVLGEDLAIYPPWAQTEGSSKHK